MYHSGDRLQLKIVSAKDKYDNKQVFTKTLTLFHKKTKQIAKLFPLGRYSANFSLAYK